MELEVDTQPRIVEVPAELAAAMAAQPTVQEFCATLSYSSQRRYVEPVGEAKTADTRARRIAKVVAALKAGKK